MSIPTSFNPLGTLGGARFTEIPYLQSSGTQWIDTGIKSSDFDEFEISGWVRERYRSPGEYFGVNESSINYEGDSAMTILETSGGFNLYYGGNAAAASVGEAFTVGVSYNWTARFTTTHAYLTVGERTASGERQGDVSDKSLYLFRGNGATTGRTYVDHGLRIFYAKFKRNGETIAHLVPRLNPAGEPCMLDLVTGNVFLNQGTGEFIYELT